MAKSMIRNLLGEKTKTFYVPTTEANAQTFATAFLDGEWEVLEQGTTSGSDSVTTANEVSVMVKGSNGDKTYFNFLAKATKNEDEIFTALNGLTLNGVLVAEAYILGMKQVSFV